MSILCGDVHWKSTYNNPYNKGLRKLFTWLAENYGDEILIQSGDYFDSSRPSWLVYDEGIEYLLKFKEVHIFPGNHDQSKNIGNSLTTFKRFPSIHTYTEKQEVMIGKQKWLMLPFQYSRETMKSYEEIQGDYDFGLGHFAPPGSNFGVDEYKISCVKRFFYGHIHLPVEENVIAVPQVTRNGEQNFEPRMFQINDETGEVNEIKLPIFFTIEDVEYGEEPVNKDNIINVVNAPSRKAVTERYEGYYIRKSGIQLNREALDDSKIETLKKYFTGSLEEKFVNFAPVFDVSEEVMDCVMEHFVKAKGV